MHNLNFRRLLSLVVVIGAATLISVPTLAQQPPPPGGPGGGGRPGGFGRGQGGMGRGGGRPISVASLSVKTLDMIVHLTPDQNKKVTVIHDDYVKALTAAIQPGQRPDRASMQKLRDLGTQTDTSIEALLTPAQKTKLDAARKDMALYRMAGIPTGLYGQLVLTSAQKAQLKALQPAPPAPGTQPDFRAMMATMQANRAKAAAILTPAQKAQVDKYLAEHPNERRGGGGRGGRGGPGGPGGPGGFAGPGGPGGPGGPRP